MNDSKANLPEGKRTVLGLYVTAKEAYTKWQAAPDQVKIIDVRTPEEYLFVGHPTMAWKIPVAVQIYEWDPEKKKFPMKPLADFVSRVKEVATPEDRLMLMCRSGGRSAIAVNMLAQAGFQHVYNIVDGMEGDANADSDQVAQAQPLKNGWKNSGCPWTKNLTSERMVLPKSLDVQLKKYYEVWGSNKTYPHMAVGWTWAMNTPFKWTKQVPSYFGGTRNGMAIAWPGHITDAGGIRTPFHHVVDIVPTILEVTGIAAPQSLNGIAQTPIEGVSMAYTFDKTNASAPSKHTTQYFEMMALRALYHDGWIASTLPYRAPWDATKQPPADIVNGVTWEVCLYWPKEPPQPSVLPPGDGTWKPPAVAVAQ